MRISPLVAMPMTAAARIIAVASPARRLTGLIILAALTLPMQAAAHDLVPFHAAEHGAFQILGPCGPDGMRIDVTGTGQGTQLGTYRARYRECFTPATGGVTDGSFTLTAANGDTLTGTYRGRVSTTGDPAVIAFADPGSITGGTGRFADARGTVTQSGVANLSTGEYTATLSGHVSSLGSE
jgi:hypothetical protein